MSQDLLAELDWLAARCASLGDHLRAARDTLKASRELDRATASIAALTRSTSPSTPSAIADGVDRAMARVADIPPLHVVSSDVRSQQALACAAVRALAARRPSVAPTAGLTSRSGSLTPGPRRIVAVCGDGVGAVGQHGSRQLGSRDR